MIDEIYVQPCDLDVLGFNNPFVQLGGAGFGYPSAFAGDPGTLEASDNPHVGGGAYTTTGDYGKLLLMHLRGGMCGDTQVLSPAALAQLHGDRIGAVYGGAARGEGTGYGMGWWIDRATGRLTDPGAFGAVPWLDLEQGFGAYLVVEADAVTGARLAAELFDVVEAAVTS